MADPRHTEPGGTDFLLALGRHVAAAVVLVLVVAGAFWTIGQVRSEDDADGPVIAEGPDATDPASPASTDDPATGGPTDTPTGTTDATSPPAPDDTDTAPDATPTSSPSPTPPAATGSPIPPGEVSVQVLDAVRESGSTAARDLADQLESDGYDVVVVNPASRVYEVTTVFYSPGHEDAARQLAAAYGFTVVEPKPDNLSDSVRVHLVVGRDRA